MNNLQMKSIIEEAYTLTFETIIDENDQPIYIVKYGDEHIETNDIDHAVEYYDNCYTHQKGSAGYFKI